MSDLKGIEYKRFEDIIKHDTLADDIFYGENLNEYVDTNINGEMIKMYVERK